MTVSDDLTGDSITDDLVAPTETVVLNTSYVVTEADVTAGQIDNIGTADSDQTDPVTEPETVPVPTPELAVLKEFVSNADEDGSGDVSAGDTLSYTITATNTGTANLTDVTVSDDLTGDSTTEAGPVVPGGTVVLNTSYVVQESDLGNTIANIGTADSDQTDPVTEPEMVDVPESELLLDKMFVDFVDNDGSLDISVGDVVNYDIKATNNPLAFGGANLTNVTISDDLTNQSQNFGTLTPGQMATLSVSYTVLETDVGTDADTTINNIGTADSEQTDPVTDPEVVDVPFPRLTIDKDYILLDDADNSGDVTLGDTLKYTYVVTNTGTANLTNVTVDDDKLGMVTLSDNAGDDINPATSPFLAPGDSEMGMLEYVVGPEDDAATFITNVATADTVQTDPVTDTVTVPVVQKNQRSISIEDIFGANLPNQPGPGDVGTSYLPTDTNDLTLDGNMIEGGFSITDQSEDGDTGSLLVQLQGLDVDIEYKDGNKWKLLDLTGTDTSLSLWADTDLDGAVDGEIDQFIGTIDGDGGTTPSASDPLTGLHLENTVKPKGKNNNEVFDFGDPNSVIDSVAVTFDDDVNILFKFTLGASALDDLDGGAIAGNDFRLTAEAFIGGRVQQNGTPTEFFYTETFTM